MATKQISTWDVDKTKAGFVSLWEEGGAGTNTGKATIIAKPDGSKPTAVYIPRGGHLACGQHALIPVHPGYLVVKTSQWRGEYDHKIYKVIRLIPGEQPQVEVELINEFSRGEWNQPLTDAEAKVVEVAEKKAQDYHCREAYFAELKKK